MAEREGKTIVVAVDFGRASDVAIATALRMLVEGTAKELHAVYVLDPNQVVDDPDQPALQSEDEILSRAPGHVRGRISDIAFAAQLPLDTRLVHAHARLGKVADAIHQVAVDYDADMIIVGTHGRKGLDRLVLGSVAEKLVRTARCPVLVARPKDYSGLPKSERPEPPRPPGSTPPEHLEPAHDRDQVDWSGHDSDGPTGFRIV